MPRIRCRYIDCIYLESGFCGTDVIDLDPELGCSTYSQEEEEDLPKVTEWDEEEVLDEEEEEEEEEWDEEDLEEDFDEDDFEDEDDEDW